MYYDDYYYGYDSYSALDTLQNVKTGAIVALVIALIGAIALTIYFVNRKRYENSVWSPVKNWFFRLVNFDMYIFSVFAKFLYLFVTIMVIVLSFVVMFQEDGFLAGLLMLILGPIVVRVVNELTYILFAMRDQLSSVNRTLTDIKQGKGAEMPTAYAAPTRPAPAAAPARPVAPAAPAAPARPAAPAAAPRPAAPMGAAPQPARPAAPQAAARRFCPKCGAEVKAGAPFCTNCGSKMA